MKAEITIVGAGAAGLMAGRELAKSRKKVIILEAKSRIGGRIWPLPKEEFNFQAQAGAEFVHGHAPITKSLAEKAGLTLTQTEGDMWDMLNGKLTINQKPIYHQEEFIKKLKEQNEDIPVAKFIKKFFYENRYDRLREAIYRMVEQYDAADPDKISTFALRDEWLGQKEWLQYRIKEGYGALLDFLESENTRYGTKIYLNKIVQKIELNSHVKTYCADGSIYESEKVIVTAALPTIKDIFFQPAIPDKLKAARKIGFGGAIKLIFKFKNRWWTNALGKDFSEMDFMRTGKIFGIWWTQYPDLNPILTGWLGGPKSELFIDKSSAKIIEVALSSLADIFKVEKKYIKNQIIHARVFNWLADPFFKGAYSYTTPETEKAQEELLKPINNKIFFAGEALFKGNDTATVEGALASGLEVVNQCTMAS